MKFDMKKNINKKFALNLSIKVLFLTDVLKLNFDKVEI